MSIPKISKKIQDFFVGEEGSISKDKIIKVGILISAASIGSGVANADAYYVKLNFQHTNGICGITGFTGQDWHTNNSVEHANAINFAKQNNIATGTHCNGQNSHSSFWGVWDTGHSSGW